MALNDYVEQTYKIECRGRTFNREEVLETPVNVNVIIYKGPHSNMISSRIECIYNTGPHGERCKAAHPRADKIYKDIICPYAFNLPDALDSKRR